MVPEWGRAVEQRNLKLCLAPQCSATTNSTATSDNNTHSLRASRSMPLSPTDFKQVHRREEEDCWSITTAVQEQEDCFSIPSSERTIVVSNVSITIEEQLLSVANALLEPFTNDDDMVCIINIVNQPLFWSSSMDTSLSFLQTIMGGLMNDRHFESLAHLLQEISSRNRPLFVQQLEGVRMNKRHHNSHQPEEELSDITNEFTADNRSSDQHRDLHHMQRSPRSGGDENSEGATALPRGIRRIHPVPLPVVGNPVIPRNAAAGNLDATPDVVNNPIPTALALDDLAVNNPGLVLPPPRGQQVPP